jgi:hypothetical protein
VPSLCHFFVPPKCLIYKYVKETAQMARVAQGVLIRARPHARVNPCESVPSVPERELSIYYSRLSGTKGGTGGGTAPCHSRPDPVPARLEHPGAVPASQKQPRFRAAKEPASARLPSKATPNQPSGPIGALRAFLGHAASVWLPGLARQPVERRRCFPKRPL